jgi:hypothetical protein
VLLSVIVADVSDDGSIARENVAVGVVAVETGATPLGENAVNVGGLGAVAATSNDHTYGPTIGTPSVVVIVAARRAVYVAPSASAEVGSSVACRVVLS